MQTKFKLFLNESNSTIEVREIGEVLTSYAISCIRQNAKIKSDDLLIFDNSGKYKTQFEIKINYDTDLEELLSRCKYVSGVYRLSKLTHWIDMGNGLNNIVIETYTRNATIYNIFSGEEKLNKFLNKLEEIIKLEITENKYNL